MKRVTLFSILLVLGVVISQFFFLIEEPKREITQEIIRFLSFIGLAFIMIHVGFEFTIDKTRLKSYGWDYFVAFTAAAFPWLFCTCYFVFFFQHREGVSNLDIWIDALLLGRFASPTSAGILFLMLEAAGLDTTWVYQKARILAIFDDLDTILLLIPIKMLIVGFRWESILLLIVIISLVYFAWKKLHSFFLPLNWYFVLAYSLLITFLLEGIYIVSKYLENVEAIQIEILLPAFVLGCIMVVPNNIHEFLNHTWEKRAKVIIAALFMLCVGLSMPVIGIDDSQVGKNDIFGFNFGNLSLQMIIWHVLAITFLSNLGKMFPLFCYRKEATVKERLAVSVSMFPRGEVGAGIIIVSLALITHLEKSLIFIAMISLVLNLVLTGLFIFIVKKLLSEKGGGRNVRSSKRRTA